MIHVALLIACAIAIYLACEWFVNAVEWLGVRMRVGNAAVGTILAAVGTALPESIVTLMAVLFGSRAQGDDIAVGAALGGPLVVGTIAYAVTGATLLYKKSKACSEVHELVSVGGSRTDHPAAPVSASPHEIGDLAGGSWQRLVRDQTWFLAIFTVKVGLGLVAFAIKPWLGIAFFAVYALYFVKQMSGNGNSDRASADGLARLKLQPRRAVPSTTAVVAQTLGTLAVIFAASQVFVRQLEWAGPALGLPAMVVALLLAPIATELPEIMNAVIWVRQGKTELALANISGSMMIQATVPSGIGLLATSWRFDTPLLLAGLATMASVAYLLWLFHTNRVTARRLAGAGLFYVAFALGLIISM